MAAQPIVVEQTFTVPVERVWRAITDEREMPRWFFERIASFRRRHPDAVKHQRGEGPQKIVYDWSHPGIPGAAVVTWELSKAGEGSHLRLTFTGIETFPQDDPAFTREACTGGWEYFLGRLKRFVETGNP